MSNPTNAAAWKSLDALASKYRARDFRNSFRADAGRFDRYSTSIDGLFLDYSKNNIEDEVLSQLMALAHELELSKGIEAFFGGEKINLTENRSVLHPALRGGEKATFRVGEEDVMSQVRLVRAQIQDFSESIRNGEWKGARGNRIKHIVNIGIGGSDLGPSMVCEALEAYSSKNLSVHFVSNVDASHLHKALSSCKAEETLFIIASKTFTTQETMANARSAKAWFLKEMSVSDVSSHFVAVSTNGDEVEKFGIDPENMFVFWDWVGGRYSVWSAIGLSIACYIGYDNFLAFLAGAEEVDNHFRKTDFASNIPVILALIGIWNRNFLDYTSEALIPYEQYLHRFPAYFQQGNMESNGKSVDRDGNRISYSTGPVVWGEPGTNGQHAFFQLLHQGTDIIPIDFLIGANPIHEMGPHYDYLLANCLAQSEALFAGQSVDQAKHEMEKSGIESDEAQMLSPFKEFKGGRPSNTLVYDMLDPKTLGKLIAVYEHKIFVQGWLWNINSFDQWGVELGKVLGKGLVKHIQEDTLPEEHSPSFGLLQEMRKRRLKR